MRFTQTAIVISTPHCLADFRLQRLLDDQQIGNSEMKPSLFLVFDSRKESMKQFLDGLGSLTFLMEKKAGSNGFWPNILILLCDLDQADIRPAP